jgi:hypothetical protein
MKEFYPEDGSSMFLPNVDSQLLEHGVITQKTVMWKHLRLVQAKFSRNVMWY